MGPKYSVLVATISERTRDLEGLLFRLSAQLRDVPKDSVEIVWFGDNRQRSVGAKRNGLLQLAQGDFLGFVDDDDVVADDYLPRLVSAITANPHADVIVFDQTCTIDGGPMIHCRYGVELDYTWDGGAEWFGRPAHTQCWRSSIAKRHPFPEIQCGEDTDWAWRCSADVREQVRLDWIGYHYPYITEKSRTRGL